MKEARFIRPGMALGFFVVAFLLAVASAASACTLFEGSITITGGTVSSGTFTPTPAADVPAGFPAPGSSVAWGQGTGMTYCLGGNPTGYAYAPKLAGWAEVKVAPHTCGSSTLKLPAATGGTVYDVNFLNVGAFTNYSNRNWVQDCMSDALSASGSGTPGVMSTQTRKVGEVTVSSTGSGTATVPLNLNGLPNVSNVTTSPSGSTGLVPSEEAGICVSTKFGTSNPPHGMQGPITIV